MKRIIAWLCRSGFRRGGYIGPTPSAGRAFCTCYGAPLGTPTRFIDGESFTIKGVRFWGPKSLFRVAPALPLDAINPPHIIAHAPAERSQWEGWQGEEFDGWCRNAPELLKWTTAL